MKIPSIGSRKAPITRDNYGDAIGCVVPILYRRGGVKRKRRKNRSEVRGISSSYSGGRQRRLYSAKSPEISEDMRRKYYCTKKKKEEE